MKILLTLNMHIYAQLEFLRIYYGYQTYNDLLTYMIENFDCINLEDNSIQSISNNINNFSDVKKIKLNISLNSKTKINIFKIDDCMSNTEIIHYLISYYALLVCITSNYDKYIMFVENEKKESITCCKNSYNF